jgi:O-methyltransferase involved in polyketide biosynthesis
VVTKVELTGERATLLGTLYGRALDAGSAQPILGDHWARDVVEQIEVDVKSTGLRSSDEQAVALRAKQLDDWVREFLDRHTEAVVLHLGCGLDTRYFRLAPAPGVLWYEVDYPEVIALRSQLLPAADSVHPIGSSVTDLACWTRCQQTGSCWLSPRAFAAWQLVLPPSACFTSLTAAELRDWWHPWRAPHPVFVFVPCDARIRSVAASR